PPLEALSYRRTVALSAFPRRDLPVETVVASDKCFLDRGAWLNRSRVRGRHLATRWSAFSHGPPRCGIHVGPSGPRAESSMETGWIRAPGGADPSGGGQASASQRRLGRLFSDRPRLPYSDPDAACRFLGRLGYAAVPPL